MNTLKYEYSRKVMKILLGFIFCIHGLYHVKFMVNEALDNINSKDHHFVNNILTVYFFIYPSIVMITNGLRLVEKNIQ